MDESRVVLDGQSAPSGQYRGDGRTMTAAREYKDI